MLLNTFLYIFAFVGLILFIYNELRRWRHPELYKGDTGIPGPMGVAGMPGVCNCACCNGEGCEKLESLSGPRTKEDVYNLPPIPEDK